MIDSNPARRCTNLLYVTGANLHIRKNKQVQMGKTRLRDKTEPAVFAPKVAKQQLTYFFKLFIQSQEETQSSALHTHFAIGHLSRLCSNLECVIRTKHFKFPAFCYSYDYFHYHVRKPHPRILY